MDALIRIGYDDGLPGSVVLDREDHWRPGDDSMESRALAGLVEAEYRFYRANEYSPAHGYPGYAFVAERAKQRGRKVEQKPPPPSPEGVVH